MDPVVLRKRLANYIYPGPTGIVMMTDTHNAIITTAAFVPVHLPLLGIHMLDHPVTVQ